MREEEDPKPPPARVRELYDHPHVDGVIYFRRVELVLIEEPVIYVELPGSGMIYDLLEDLGIAFAKFQTEESRTDVGGWMVYFSRYDDEILGVCVNDAAKGTNLVKSIRRTMRAVVRGCHNG